LKQYFVLGSYSEPILFGTGEVFHGKGRGISLCSLEEGRIELLGEIPLANPSFLCLDEKNRWLYAVNEVKEYLGEGGGGLTRLSYTEDFNFSVEGSWNTGGEDPCHVSLSPDKRFLAVANYSGSSFTIFPLDEKGQIGGESRTIVRHSGSSSHPERQKGPHVHSCIFSQEHPLLYTVDLGTDRVIAYDYSRGTLFREDSLSISVPSGSGPRYGEFSRDGGHFYLINELSSEIMHFTCLRGALTLRQTVRTLPGEFRGSSTCADLHLTPDGSLLFASNRGHDSIVSYRVEKDGDLTFLARQSCGGRTPRNFAVDPAGSHLLVGNQDSDLISVFRIHPDGGLEMINNWDTGSPVCILFFSN